MTVYLTSASYHRIWKSRAIIAWHSPTASGLTPYDAKLNSLPNYFNKKLSKEVPRCLIAHLRKSKYLRLQRRDPSYHPNDEILEKKAMEGRGCPRHSKLSRYDLHAHLAVVGNFHLWTKISMNLQYIGRMNDSTR